jgi:hypothetical protein
MNINHYNLCTLGYLTWCLHPKYVHFGGIILSLWFTHCVYLLKEKKRRKNYSSWFCVIVKDLWHYLKSYRVLNICKKASLFNYSMSLFLLLCICVLPVFRSMYPTKTLNWASVGLEEEALMFELLESLMIKSLRRTVNNNLSLSYKMES